MVRNAKNNVKIKKLERNDNTLKIGLLLCMLLFSVTNYSYAQETPAGKDKISAGTYALIQSQKSGGGLSFSFPVFQKKDFVIREEINANLYFPNQPLTFAKYVSLGNKIHFGSIKKINGFTFRSYGYSKCEFGFTWDKSSRPFTEAPVVLEMGGAGGFEFLYSPEKSFFIEFGGGSAIKSWGSVSLEDFAAGSLKCGYVCITTGAKYYF